jgi:FkbM family methyltransferase
MTQIGNHLYRLWLYALCRYAANWRGIWRLKLGERALVYRFAQSGNLVTKTKWGVPIEVRKNDSVGHTVYFFGDYERKLLNAIRRELKSGDVALDIGANIGVVSLYCATLVGQTGRVFAIEPLQQNHELLQRNLQRAGFDNVIQAELCALGAEEKSVTIQFNEYTDNWGNTSLLNQSGASRQEVSMLRLDTLWEKWGRPQITFVKLDVEGFEIEVLKGATRLLRQSPPKVWIVEFNLDYLSRQDNGVANLWNYFINHAYTPYHMKTRTRMAQPPTAHCDVLFRLEQ